MKNTGINPVVIKEIRQMAQQCGLARVILFGSRARGDFTKVSILTLPLLAATLRDLRWILKKRQRFCALMLLIWINRYRKNCGRPLLMKG